MRKQQGSTGKKPDVNVGKPAYDTVSKKESDVHQVKRLCGLMMFCVGAGMALKVLFPTTLTLLIFIVGLMAVGGIIWVVWWATQCYGWTLCLHEESGGLG